jgi:hypothetical protein
MEGFNVDCPKLSIWYRPGIPQFLRIVAGRWAFFRPNRTNAKGHKRKEVMKLWRHAVRRPDPLQQSRRNDSHPGPADKGRALDFLQNSAGSIRWPAF